MFLLIVSDLGLIGLCIFFIANAFAFLRDLALQCVDVPAYSLSVVAGMISLAALSGRTFIRLCWACGVDKDHLLVLGLGMAATSAFIGWAIHVVMPYRQLTT
ncbi:MAG: hypothetical protein KDB00_10815 [Planctomycetales bacterium]|nr:hypothetical protein [Planctomycetales bacterium]